jgi:hypothetical protein
MFGDPLKPVRVGAMRELAIIGNHGGGPELPALFTQARQPHRGTPSPGSNRTQQRRVYSYFFLLHLLGNG